MCAQSASKEAEVIEAVLRDGRSLRLRPISSDDKKLLEEFFYRLSPETRYFRFHYAKERITAEELKVFTEVAPPERQAYVATCEVEGAERIIAVARWDLVKDSKTAEVAFVVEDGTQKQGIGTVLLEALYQGALSCRIEHFIARILPENIRMIDVFMESGFKATKKTVDNIVEITMDLKRQAEYEARQSHKEHIARSAGIRKLLNPRRVAIVGASRNPVSVGGAVFRNMLKDGFTGVVFPVNPNTDSIAGVLSYKSISEIPGDIDLAVIVIPADGVIAAIEEAAKKGAAGAVIITAGFSEAGHEGIEKERALLKKVLAYGMRVIGPNCLGALSNNPEVRLNATFSPVNATAGRLSIGSQSGALGLALLDHARAINLGIEDFVSIGNRMDVSNNDLLEFWEDDPRTNVIVLYLESFGNPRKFARIARRVSHKKPIIAVKSGRSSVGAKAASSHTGALAAADVAVDALFRQAGVIRVNSIQAMFNAAEVLTHQPLPRGPRVAILTNAGGPGVMAADACDSMCLKVLPLSRETQAKLREFLPKSAATTNPVDMIASAPPQSFARSLSILLDDPEVDSVIVIYIPPLVTRPEDVAAAVRDVLKTRSLDKPVVTCFMMSPDQLVKLRTDEGYQLRPFVFPEDAVYALSLANEYAQYREMEEGQIPLFKDIDSEKARTVLFAKGQKKGWLLPEEASGLLNSYGIKTPETHICVDLEEAKKGAAKTGYPVVMKLRSSTIVHKTEVKGVIVNIADEAALKKAYDEIKRSLAAKGLEGAFEGVIVQEMVTGGVEMIIGMNMDPVFGPVLMTGFGGVQVELVKDVAFAIHPLRDVDPDRMLQRLKSLPLLLGWRGAPLADVAALKDALLRLSALIEDFPEIDQMEINPLIVMNEGKGVRAVDVRISISGD